jgi:hypothetical protein
MDLSTLGFASAFVRALQYSVCPTLNFTDTASIGSQVPNQAHVTQYQPSVNVHSVYGRHSLKYGVRYTDERQSTYSRTQPTFNFTRIFTQGPNPESGQQQRRIFYGLFVPRSARHRQCAYRCRPRELPSAITPSTCRMTGRSPAV